MRCRHRHIYILLALVLFLIGWKKWRKFFLANHRAKLKQERITFVCLSQTGSSHLYQILYIESRSTCLSSDQSIWNGAGKSLWKVCQVCSNIKVTDISMGFDRKRTFKDNVRLFFYVLQVPVFWCRLWAVVGERADRSARESSGVWTSINSIIKM